MKESPDLVNVGGENLYWEDGGFAFGRGTKTNEFYIGENGEDHYSLMGNEFPQVLYTQHTNDGRSETFYVPVDLDSYEGPFPGKDMGRVFFTKDKTMVITLWPNSVDGTYPTKHEFDVIVNELKKHNYPGIKKFFADAVVELPVSEEIVPASEYFQESAGKEEIQARDLHLAKNKAQILKKMGAKGWGSQKKLPGQTTEPTAAYRHKYSPVGENSKKIIHSPVGNRSQAVSKTA